MVELVHVHSQINVIMLIVKVVIILLACIIKKFIFRSCIKHPDTNCIKGGFSADGTTIVCFTCNS